MVVLRSVFVVMLGCLLCCGRLSYISARAINLVEALPLTRNQWQADQQPSSFDKRELYRPGSSDTATELADTENGRREEKMKRLVGLFRCSGWGPSCSSDYYDYNDAALHSQQALQRSSNPVHHVRGEQDSATVNNQAAARSKFQPFFTLTSGKYRIRVE